MKIYTRTGDEGETGLFAGPRVRKDDARIEAYGSVDELNAWLGLVRCEQPPAEIEAVLERVQHELFAVGSELATPDPDKHQMRQIADRHIAALEAAIDDSEAQLAPLRQFVLPGGTRLAAQLHVARCVCRRAERAVVALASQEPGKSFSAIIRYLNRLSDLLFSLARLANAQAGVPDIPWEKR